LFKLTSRRGVISAFAGAAYRVLWVH